MLGGSDRVTVELPYPPSVNKIYRRRKDGAVILHDRVHEWKRRAGWAYKAAGGRLLHGTIRVDIELYRPQHAARSDIDNGLKVTLDSMNGVAWRDDDQVALLVVAKLAPSGAGKMVLTVTEVKKKGPLPA